MNIGPKKQITYYCQGCVHLKTNEWEFYGENDEMDFGIDAECLKLGKHLTSYYSSSYITPDTCPYIKKDGDY